MTDKEFKTHYAPAERASEDQINQEADALRALPLLVQLLDSIPDIVLILNKQRQIIFANQALADALNISDRGAIYGLRPGEALHCIHADEDIGGCGTTLFCKTCGAVNAIIPGLRGKKTTQECRIFQKDTGNAYDLRVAATPFNTENFSYVIFVVTDISNEKRRNVLERTFFHDISNTLSGITGYTDLLFLSQSSNNEKMLKRLAFYVKRLSEEIDSQRGLISAENGELSVSPRNIRSLDLLNEIASTYKAIESFKDYLGIYICDKSIDIIFVSDKTLLSRVLGNMLKNALEASRPDEKILLGCTLDNNCIRFWVQNSKFIPPDDQLQIFNRSFSTKGNGRGIGTYSMKLLIERYLHGKISFSSTPEQGTFFSATVPLILDLEKNKEDPLLR